MASQTTTFYDQENPNSTAWASSTAGGVQNESRDKGKVTVICDSFTTTSAVTAGSQTITLCKLPAGAKVFSAELIVPASVGTSSAKLGLFNINADGTLGSADDDDAYGAGKDLSSAARVQFIATAADSDRTTSGERALVLSPVTTNFATAILFSWIILYTTGN